MKNRKGSRFFYKLIIRVISPLIIVLFIVEIVNYYNTRNRLKHANEEKNNIIINEIKTIQEFQDIALQILEKSLNQRLNEFSKRLVNIYFRKTDNIELEDLNNIRLALGMNPKFEDIYIINSEGIVVNTTFKKDLMLNFFDFGREHEEFLLKILKGNKFVSNPFAIEQNTKRPRKYTYQPTIDNKYIIELGIYSNKADELIEFISEHLHDIAKSEESIKEINLFIGADHPFSLSKGVNLTESESEILNAVFKNKIKYRIVEDEDNPNIVTEYLFIKKQNSDLYSGSVIQIKTDRTFEQKLLRAELVKSIIIAIVVSILFFSIVFIWINHDISKPLTKLQHILRSMMNGDIDKSLLFETRLNNEIGNIIRSTNQVIINLNKIYNFAKEIGKGNWGAKYELISKKDELGNSLNRMQQNLKKIREEEEQRKVRDFQHKWATDGVARFTEILRENQDNLPVLCNNIIKNIIKYVGADIGGVFVYNDDNKEDIHLRLIAAYAYDKFSHQKIRIKLGEGLVGMCALEKYMIYRKDIPRQYVNIESGIGEAYPKTLLLIPLKLQNEIYGVIELASFKEFEEYKIKFIETIAENISYTLSSVKNNAKTIRLLEQSKKQSEEFKSMEKMLKNDITSLEKDKERLLNKQEELNSYISSLSNELIEAKRKYNLLLRKVNY